MIIYLKNSEIDRKLWDACIKNARSRKPYAYSWYLDIMAPGWEALVDDEYDAVFPVPGFKKFGIKYVATPVFLQQLGVFSPDKPAGKAINEFLYYMPEFFRLIDLCVGQKIDKEGFKVTERANYELDLSKPYETIRKNFSKACRKNIRKAARHNPEFTSAIKPDELITLFRTTYANEITGIKNTDYQRLNKLMKYCIETGKGSIEGIRNEENKLVFGQFYIKYDGFISLLFNANTIISREKLYNYSFFDKLIRENAGKQMVLDFEGSSILSVASFVASFGGVMKPYYRIYRNNLSWPLRLLK